MSPTRGSLSHTDSKEKQLTQPSVHMSQARPKDCQAAGSYAARKVEGVEEYLAWPLRSGRSGGAWRTPSSQQALRPLPVSHGRDREGHEHMSH